MSRAKLSLPSRKQTEPTDAEDGLQSQTIAAEVERVRGCPFSAVDVAAELECSEAVAAALGEYLMPRGQRFHVRRVLTHIAAYLHLDAARLRDLLGRADPQESSPGNTFTPDEGGSRGNRVPQVTVIRRRGTRLQSATAGPADRSGVAGHGY